MSLTNAELLIIKAELTNDPLALGLTTLSQDDEANASKLNETRDSIRVYRASIPSDELLIPVDEWAALSQGHQSWWAMQTADGSIKPSVLESEFFTMFGADTQARANWETATKENSSRAIQLLGRWVNLTPSDVANARQAA